MKKETKVAVGRWIRFTVLVMVILWAGLGITTTQVRASRDIKALQAIHTQKFYLIENTLDDMNKVLKRRTYPQ